MRKVPLQRKQHFTAINSTCAKSQSFKITLRDRTVLLSTQVRKHRVVVLLAVIFSLHAFSQQQFGIKAGVVHSTLVEDFENSYMKRSWVSGYQVGITTNLPLSSQLSLQPSIQLTQKGYKAVQGTPGVPFYWYRNARLTYLEVPLDVRYSIGKKKGL